MRVTDRLVGERDLQRERARLRGHGVGPAGPVEHALEHRRRVDGPWDPAPHAVKTGPDDGPVGGDPRAERRHVRRHDRSVDAGPNERGRAAGDVDDEDVGPA